MNIMNRESLKRHCEAMCYRFKGDPTSGAYGEHRLVLELLEQTTWIPVSERLPEEDGDYFVTYEKGYAEDYDLPPIGIAGFEVDCEGFGYWYEHFDRQTLGSLGSEWEEIKVVAWMPLPEPYKVDRSE